MSSAARTRTVRLLVRLAISGIALFVFALHIAGKPRYEILDRIENYLYDVRIRMTMPGTVDERIVIVDIDEASQAELGQWPWPRNTLAAIVDRLFDDYGIRVLGLDALGGFAVRRDQDLVALAAQDPGDERAHLRLVFERMLCIGEIGAKPHQPPAREPGKTFGKCGTPGQDLVAVACQPLAEVLHSPKGRPVAASHATSGSEGWIRIRPI